MLKKNTTPSETSESINMINMMPPFDSLFLRFSANHNQANDSQSWKLVGFPLNNRKPMHHTLPETNILVAPEHRPKPKRKGSSSNHRFLGDMLVSGSVHLRFMVFPLIPLVRLEDFWCQILEMSFMHPKHVSNTGFAANVKNDEQGKSCKKKGLFS